MRMYDHNGNLVKYEKIRVNGIKLHYIIAGEGEPLLLIHGTPKSNIYWCKIIPLLTERFTIIAPDLRGFGNSDKPAASEGYDNLTMVQDLYDLMQYLGYDRFYIHGEDRGAEYGFVYAAKYPEQVIAMTFGEMAISGYGIEEASYFTKENISAQYSKKGNWLWHVPFFFVKDIPEMLLSGNECNFWNYLLYNSAYDAEAIPDEVIKEWNRFFVSPGGMRGILETYRAGMINNQINTEILNTHGKLNLPVITIGGSEFYGITIKEYGSRIFNNIKKFVLLENCGHHLAFEKPKELAETILELLNFK